MLFSQLKLPGYERWAVKARAWVDEREKTRVADKVAAVDEGAKAAFESTNRRLDHQDEQITTLIEQIKMSNQRNAERDEREAIKDAQIASLLSYIQAGNNGPPPAALGKFCFVFVCWSFCNFLFLTTLF